MYREISKCPIMCSVLIIILAVSVCHHFYLSDYVVVILMNGSDVFRCIMD
jgi:hypothetical protein